MSPRMSCSMTVDAVRDRTKTVTRRHVDSWRTLKPGDRLTLIEKGMGLPKGARQVVLAEVEVVAVDVRPLFPITLNELDAEGFPSDDPLGLSPAGFCQMWLASHGYGQFVGFNWQFEAEVTQCRRIEWRYLDEATAA